MRILDFFKRLFKRKKQKEISVVHIPNPIPIHIPQMSHHHIPESKLYKPRNQYQKRMWGNNKRLPKNFRDEDEE